MKPTKNNVALALSFFICLCNFHLLIAKPNTKLVTETCQKVKNKDLCLSSLTAEHASQDATDVTTIALIAIKIATNNGSNTAVYIKKTTNNGSNTAVYIKKTLDGNIKEPTIQQNFEDCAENFGDAMLELDDALAFIISRDYKKLKLELASAIDDATTCASVLGKKGRKDMDLSNKTNVFCELCAIALDIVNILAPN